MCERCVDVWQVIFELRDKSGEDYSAEKFTAFAGSGQAVGAPPKVCVSTLPGDFLICLLSLH